MKKTLFLVLGLIVVLILGYQVVDAYLANHTYYRGTADSVGMMGTGMNRKILFWSVCFACIPLSYLLFAQKKSLKRFSVAVFVGLFLYSVAQATVKQSILGPGFLLLLFKYAWICALIAGFLIALLATGTRIRKKFFGTHEWNIEQIFLNLGLGLIAFCLLNILLILFHLYYGVIILLIFVLYGVCSWFMRKDLSHARVTFERILDEISWKKVKTSPLFFVYALLVLFSLLYLYHGFVLADIPYPTAWDANHAYMYIPKVWALGNGYDWQQAVGVNPNLWLAYIAYWFKFMYLFGLNTWVSADNLAVIMNFLSGIFVLVFGVVLVKEVLHFINPDGGKSNNLYFVIGWFLVLLWLTSGMGAFLVFIDNKTDLGIMALTILALYSGFMFINNTAKHTEGKQSLQYVILSGIFFAAAILAKPTATFDVINFSITLVALRFGGLLAFGIFLIFMGILGKSGILTASKFISPSLAYQLMGAGGVVSIFGAVRTWLQKKWTYLRYFLVWGAVIAGTLIIVKVPYLLVKQIRTDNTIHPIQLIKDIILTKKDAPPATPRILLASNTPVSDIMTFDVGGTTTTEPDANLLSCQAKEISKEDLYKNLKTPPGGSLTEDVGRYIGYGRKDFLSPRWGFAVGKGCHSLSADAKILCENEKLFDKSSAAEMQALYDKLPQGSEGRRLVGVILSGSMNTTQDSQAKSALLNVKSYYQDKSWKKEGVKVSVPYTMLVPFNITFNWSLQNLTSYYTDIGIIWIIALMLIVLGFIYSLVQRNKKLFAITLSTLGAWTLRWIAGGAILWYSLGVILWTIIAMILVFFTFGEKNTGLNKKLFTALIAIFALLGIYQLMLNFIRISSQGGGGAFVWYRGNVGEVNYFDDNLQQKAKQKVGYNSHDIFNLQFPYYNAALKIADNRTEEEGIVIAGTYLPYFITNQSNIEADGFLEKLWKNLSDNDPCNTYLRLRDQKIKHIVIDPNIASVVMGEANSTLFDRFFGKLATGQELINEYGSMTMITKLIQDGYMELSTTNVINAKYAFMLPYEQLQASLPQYQGNETLLRAKFATLRFRPEAQQIFNATINLFTQRVMNGEALQDVADIFGKEIRLEVVQPLVTSILSKQNITPETFKNITDDEKESLVQYISIYNLLKSNTQQYQQVVSNIIQQSILGSSQIMVFTRK